ncbi:MAG: DUF3459 domain-containing protein [Anaerolineae bacterium]|nr:DUF3459 domain-containing protein [Anaerolineae bacterium]
MKNTRRISLLLILTLVLFGIAGARAQDDPGDALPWWNDRVFYEIFVRSFYDSDGDGAGDLQGVIEKLDYLNDGDPDTTGDLGVTGIWLMPVAESPSYHGYDVVDYRQIESDYGANEDFTALVEAAHARGIAVIVDLVVNHTSNEHPWFVASAAGDPEYAGWYIWTDDPAAAGQRGPWSQPIWHRAGDRLYYGVFWSGMPDLNYATPAVTQEMQDIARFWLEDMGADGFRLDAVKYIYENEIALENLPITQEWLADFNDFLKEVNPDALAVGEAWDASRVAAQYVAKDSVDLVFEFDLAGAILSGAWVGSTAPVREAQARVLELYPPGQYAAFLSNHDQKRVMNAVKDNENAAKVAAALLLTNPGVPFIYYGEEVGMRGDKPDERIRTPMQWDDSAAVGFTSGPPWEAPSDGVEGHNVAAQTGDPDSLLSHYRNLIHLRNAHPALRRGAFLPVETEARGLYSFLRYTDDEILLVLINMKRVEIEGYRLDLAAGPLATVAAAEVVFGAEAGTAAALPQVNAAGGFDAYAPTPALAPYSTTVIRLTP